MAKSPAFTCKFMPKKEDGHQNELVTVPLKAIY
jgi:hypothetical protein